jgi:hypothetical protein
LTPGAGGEAALSLGAVSHTGMFGIDYAGTIAPGVIQGGTIVNAGAVAVTLGTLDGVTWEGALDLGGLNADLTLSGAYAFVPLGGGQENVTLDGPGSEIHFGDGTLVDTVIHAGGGTAEVALAAPSTQGQALTLDASSTLAVDQAGTAPVSLFGNIVNQGLVSITQDNAAIGGSNYYYDPGSGVIITVVYPPSLGSPPPPRSFSGGSAPASFDNQGTLEIAAGRTVWIGNVGTFANEGTVKVGTGGLLWVQTPSFANTGSIVVGGGTLDLEPSPAAAMNAGTIDVSGGGLVKMVGGTLGATLLGLNPGVTVDLNALTYAAGASAVAAGGTLTVTSGGTTDVLAAPGLADGSYTAASDGYGTVVTFASPACFAEGTRIAAAEGDVAVERLRVGDLVRTRGGALREVVWVGHREVECGRHPRPWDMMPVRIEAGAFGPGRPGRALWLSPDHAVFVRGVLVPVRYLVNGASIAQVAVERVTYWHVELASHDVVLAEGLACETYLDTGNRSAFVEGGPALKLHPEFATGRAREVWAAAGCAPLVDGGPLVVAERRRRLARARRLGFVLDDDPELGVIAGGARLVPTRLGTEVYRFALPAGCRSVVIGSRSGVPAEVEAAGTDGRRLGVMLGAAIVRAAGFRRDVLAEARGPGFHGMEGDGPRRWRWTDGAARLDLPGDVPAGPAFLDLVVLANQASWRRQAVRREAGAAG